MVLVTHTCITWIFSANLRFRANIQGNFSLILPRNASLVIGQCLVARYQKPLQEKPSTPLPRVERVEKSTGVLLSQAVKRKEEPSSLQARRGGRNEHGAAQGRRHRMGTPCPSIPRQLRLPLE